MVNHHLKSARAGFSGVGQGGTLGSDPKSQGGMLGLKGKIIGLGVARDSNGNIKVDKDVDYSRYVGQDGSC